MDTSPKFFLTSLVCLPILVIMYYLLVATCCRRTSLQPGALASEDMKAGMERPLL